MVSSGHVSFSVPQRIIHWTMALLIFFNLLFPEAMAHAYRLIRRGETLTPDQISSANIHAYVGFAILILAVLRLSLRFRHGVPPHPAEEPRPFQIAAKVAHFTFTPCSLSYLCPASPLITSELRQPGNCIPAPSRR